MAGTDPISGARIGDMNDGPLGGLYLAQIVTDLRTFLNNRFPTQSARDAAYTAAGVTLKNGMSCWTDDAGFWDRTGGAWVLRTSPARLRLTATDDASLTSTLHAFQIGPTSGLNMIMDSNEITVRNNGAAAGLSFGDCSQVLVPAPTAVTSAATKAYVDSFLAVADPAWINATYQSGWATDTTHGPHARYRKLLNGQVEVQGAIKSGAIGSAFPAFQLPTGYRPGDLLVTPQLGNDALARVDFRTDGTVAVISGSTAAYTTVNWTFYADN